MKVEKVPILPRHQRYSAGGQIKAIVKNARSRCACFWLDVANVSASGVGIEYSGRGHIPFAVNDELHLTLDTGCMIFRRPIHVTVHVKWREDCPPDTESSQHRTFMGCQISLIDPIHIAVWDDGLKKLAALGEDDWYEAGLLVANG